MFRILLSVLVALALNFSVLQAGWIITQSTTDEDGYSDQETIYFQNNKIRNDTEGQTTVMNLESGQMLMINHSQKKYWKGSYSKMMEESKDAAKQQMEQMMEDMSPEQREAYQQYMDQMDESPMDDDETASQQDIQIKEKSSTQKILGHTAKLYEVWVNGEKVEDAWVAGDLPVMQEIDADKFAEFLEEMTDESSGASYEDSKEYRKLLEKGFPLKTIEYSNMGNTIIQVTEIKEQSIPDSDFDAPAGYSNVPIQQLWQGME